MLTKPPFCPNPDCVYHDEGMIPYSQQEKWYNRDGYYHTRINGPIKRFVCKHCGRRFSVQTFSIDYGVKMHIDYQRVFDQINSGAGIRSLARNLKVSEVVINNRISRLARNAIAMHSRLRKWVLLNEALVADGFEGFTVSQFFPNNIHLAVGKDSQYLYGIDYSHIRRKGVMRDDQKEKRKILEKKWKSPRQDILRSFIRILRQIDEYRNKNSNQFVHLYTDEKLEYRKAVKEVSWILHTTVPSTAPRTVTNDLFAVNYYDREIRKDQSNHTRETVQFSRDVNNAMDRLWVYSVYHNYEKPFRINNRREKKCHSEYAGIPLKAIKKERRTFFTRRAFLSKLHLSESEWYSWYRCYETPLKQIISWYPRYAAA